MIHEFGPFRYDSDQRVLLRGGETVALAPKAIDTLHVLIERRGAIVDKAELMRLVWPDTNVEEIGLARNISLLRKALEGDYIETIPKRGYRFTAEQAPPAITPRRRWPLLLFLIPIAALTYYLFYVPSRFLPRGQTALAVAPIECLCPEMDGARFARGVEDVVAASLTQVPGVQVVGPSTVRRYAHVGISMGWMGRVLGLDILVEATVQQMGPRMKATARLVDVHTGKVVAADSAEMPSADLAAAQDAITRLVSAQVRNHLIPKK